MDQKKIGMFLKVLRKENNMTQEELAEKLNVSNRSISRWETGSNMPDISLLVELSELYMVSIPEIIEGESKSEKMNQDIKNTAIKMAEYSKNEVRVEKKKNIGSLLVIFGVFIIASALAVFPNESSWASIYSIIGEIIFIIGVYFRFITSQANKVLRVASIVGCVIIFLGIFTLLDYISVSQFHQVPRFSYVKSYGENEIEHKTLFYTVVQKNPGTEKECIEIVN